MILNIYLSLIRYGRLMSTCKYMQIVCGTAPPAEHKAIRRITLFSPLIIQHHAYSNITCVIDWRERDNIFHIPKDGRDGRGNRCLTWPLKPFKLMSNIIGNSPHYVPPFKGRPWWAKVCTYMYMFAYMDAEWFSKQ